MLIYDNGKYREMTDSEYVQWQEGTEPAAVDPELSLEERVEKLETIVL